MLRMEVGYGELEKGIVCNDDREEESKVREMG